jgi:hypothetical protein
LTELNQLVVGSSQRLSASGSKMKHDRSELSLRVHHASSEDSILSGTQSPLGVIDGGVPTIKMIEICFIYR